MDNRSALERWKGLDWKRHRVDTSAYRKKKATQEHLKKNEFYLMEMALRERIIMSAVFNKYIEDLQNDINQRKL